MFDLIEGLKNLFSLDGEPLSRHDWIMGIVLAIGIIAVVWAFIILGWAFGLD